MHVLVHLPEKKTQAHKVLCHLIVPDSKLEPTGNFISFLCALLASRVRIAFHNVNYLEMYSSVGPSSYTSQQTNMAFYADTWLYILDVSGNNTDKILNILSCTYCAEQT